MTKPRKEQISLDATPYYHCYVRCVRRAYLCGDDYQTGQNYDHRKQWIVSRLRFLSYIYAIDICAYAIMDNHYHTVLHVNKQRAEDWSMQEVAERWMQLYKGHMLVHRWLKEPESIDNATMGKVTEIIEEWRERLYDIGWFMRGINECIARMANEEDNCKGRFWEGRYKSQALLDEAAVLSCMAYVDLNPVRAAKENTLAESDFTSIQQRLYDYKELHSIRATEPKMSVPKVIEKRIHKQGKLKQKLGVSKQKQAELMPFDGCSHTAVDIAIPFTQEDYFDLVDTTGRMIRAGKRGFISEKSPKILEQFGINPLKWVEHVKHFGRLYGDCCGGKQAMNAFAQKFGKCWAKGGRVSAEVYAVSF